MRSFFILALFKGCLRYKTIFSPKEAVDVYFLILIFLFEEKIMFRFRDIQIFVLF